MLLLKGQLKIEGILRHALQIEKVEIIITYFEDIILMQYISQNPILKYYFLSYFIVEVDAASQINEMINKEIHEENKNNNFEEMQNKSKQNSHHKENGINPCIHFLILICLYVFRCEIKKMEIISI